MKRLTEHEFVENENGELAFLTNVLSVTTEEASLVVSPTHNSARIEIAGTSVFEVAGINPTVIDKLRATDSILVIEMDGKDIARATDIPSRLEAAA